MVSGTTQLKLTAADGKKYLMLKKELKKCVDRSKISKENYMNAMIISTVDYSVLVQLIKRALTEKINDRAMFMKGIDYSYYYEE